jgi:2-polyprenyl-3-methyl-5-hydroxy-6-metoxy-1,4-benzoquinol methylase
MEPIPQLVQCPCPLCRSEQYRRLYTIKGFSIVRCRNCRLVYVNPRLPDDAVYDVYRDQYFNRADNGYQNYELSAHLRRRTFQRWYDDLRPYLGTVNGNALDVGCAAGYFLEVLEQNGWNAAGIELDTAMHASLIERGYTASNLPLEQFPANRKFDLITLFDVAEHLPHIHVDMRKISEMLADHGIAAIVTPNIDSLQKRLMGRRWFQFKPVEHILYFSPATLKALCAQHDLEIVLLQRAGQYADCMFIHDRLQRYGFRTAAALFSKTVKLLKMQRFSWYADTGSMLAVLRKNHHPDA